MLPSALKVLHLTGTSLVNVNEESAYFKDLNSFMINLEEFDLSECTWVTAHALLSFSKLRTLFRLSLRGCRNIGNCLAYTSLASRFGFKALKYLDVTNASVGNSEFISLSSIPTLEEFYFGQYDQFTDYEFNLITDHCFITIRHSQNMRVLDLSGSQVTDEVFNIFHSIPNLTIVIAHFTGLTTQGIQRFLRERPDCTIEKTNEVFELPQVRVLSHSPALPLHFMPGGNHIVLSLM